MYLLQVCMLYITNLQSKFGSVNYIIIIFITLLESYYPYYYEHILKTCIITAYDLPCDTGNCSLLYHNY